MSLAPEPEAERTAGFRAAARQHFNRGVLEELLGGGVAGARRRLRLAFEKRQSELDSAPAQGAPGDGAWGGGWGSDDSDLDGEGNGAGAGGRIPGFSQLGDPLASPLAAMQVLLAQASRARSVEAS